MAQKTYKQIEQEANQRFGTGPSKEKFEWRREQQRLAGLDTEGKKRGGVAGAYDRNKKLVSTAATAAGYFFGGPAGAAAARGTIQGFDRPGKSGIGFDVGRGAKGALEGYAAGKVAQFGQGGLEKLMGGGSSAGTVPTQRVFDPSRGGYVDVGPTAGSVATAPATKPTIGSMLSGAGKFAKENAAVIGQGLTAGAEMLGQRGEQEVAMRKLDIEEQLRKEEQARRDRLAQLLMPMFQSQVQQYGQRPQG